MTIKDHFLSLVRQKGGFSPLHAHFDKSNIITPKLLFEAQQSSMQDKWYLYRGIKQNYTYKDIYERGVKSVYAMLGQDIKYVRTFADADTIVGQKCVDAICELKDNFAHLIEIDIAIQPLEGVVSKQTQDVFIEACSKADYVGGLPSRDKDPAEHLRILFDIANKYDLPVDVHVDQLNSPLEKETELLLDIMDECSFENKVNAVHSISLACHDISYQKEIAERLYEQDIGVIICPSAALSMKPVNYQAPIHNSIAPLKILKDHNVKVGLGIDNINDLFMPLVDADMWFECRLLMEATRCYDLDLISTIATTYI